jgi:hypothetical protein
VMNEAGVGELNDGCGAEFVQKSLQLPNGVKKGVVLIFLLMLLCS